MEYIHKQDDILLVRIYISALLYMYFKYAIIKQLHTTTYAIDV